MELFNNIAKQQTTQIHTEQKAVQSHAIPAQEMKVKVDTVKEDGGSTKPITSEVELKDLIDSLNKALDPFNTSIRFGFDNRDDIFFVSVVDTSTNDMIRRFPVEQAHSLAGKMNEIVGIIFDEKG